MILLCSRGGPLGSSVVPYLLLPPRYLPSRVLSSNQTFPLVFCHQINTRWSVLRFGRRCSKVPVHASLVEGLLRTLFFISAPSLLAAELRFTPLSFDGRLLLLVVLAGLLLHVATTVIRLTNLHLSAFTSCRDFK